MTKRWILRVGLAVFGLAILWAGQGARAGIAVAPLKQEVGLRPGETGKVTVTITNNRRNELDLTQSAGVMVMDVQVSENGALDFKEPGTAKDSAGKWVSIDQTSVTLDAGKSQIVECTVAVPVSTAPGEYYAALMITLANKGKTDKGLKIEYRIASGIFVNVLGQNYPKQGRVTRAELVWPETASTQPTTQPEPDTQPATRPAVTFPKLEVLMENTGKARFDGSGHVSIVDEHARTVFTAKLASARPCIFAGDSRIFETPLTKALPAGKYRVKVEMDYQSSWAKARYEIPVEILPASAELMAKLQLGGDGAPVVEVGPEKLTGSIPPGPCAAWPWRSSIRPTAPSGAARTLSRAGRPAMPGLPCQATNLFWQRAVESRWES